ncbi:MAG: RNA-binding protein [Acidobacteria bacterium]|nr:MAG: RNA-binding protein [Acidobacteriota bacterium]
MNRVAGFLLSNGWSAQRVSFALAFALICSGIATAQTDNKPSAPKDSPSLAQFEDIASKAGLTMTNLFGGLNTKTYIIETTGTGVAIFDYDNDGWPDIFFVNGTTLELASGSNGPSGHLYRNNHDGTFTDVTIKAGLATAVGWGQGVCVGDYDNDGWEDLYITYYGKNRLYHSQNGVFEEVAQKAGVAGSGRFWGTGCAFVDYDRDGHLDLVIANYVDFDQATAAKPGERSSCIWKGVPVMCGPRGLRGAKNILYRNRGDGSFEDVTAKAHIDRTEGQYGLGVATLDFDDDGWPDIYIACDSAPSILYRNNHDGTFTDVAVSAGVAFNEDGREQAGMGISDDTPTLYRNDGGGVFTDVTFAAGLGSHTQYLGWGTMFFDFDNDGCPDLILANGHVYPEVEKFHLGSEFKEPRILYHNNGNGTFTDVSGSAGPGISAATAARGLAVGDLWNDGRVSVLINNMNAEPSLLVNSVRSLNHWIAFKALGTRSNRDGIGAKITVIAGKRKMIDEVRSGSSYVSQNDTRVHFGLGSATKVDSVEVRWPSGLIERYNDLPLDAID